MGRTGLSVYSRVFLLYCHEKGVPLPEAELLEIGPRNDQFQTVSLVDHLDIQNATHSRTFGLGAYKGYGLNS